MERWNSLLDLAGVVLKIASLESRSLTLHRMLQVVAVIGQVLVSFRNLFFSGVDFNFLEINDSLFVLVPLFFIRQVFPFDVPVLHLLHCLVDNPIFGRSLHVFLTSLA